MAKTQEESGKGLPATVPPWRVPDGWTGQRFHLGKNEAFDAEPFVIHRAMRMTGIAYTIFSNSTAAIEREQ